MAARPPNMDDWYSRQGLTVKGGGITLQAGGAIKGGQTAYATGTGFFLGYSGGAYKFSIGSSTKYLRFDGTDVLFTGDLSGATGTFSGNLAVAGTAYIDGNQTVDTLVNALTVNSSLARAYGIYTKTSTSGGSGGHAVGTSGGFGWTASVTGGGGAIRGVATTSGYGVIATGLSGATALAITGPTTTDSQITSTLATGTAPLVVASTTKVTNLNADLLDGNDSTAFATAGHNHSGVYQAAGNYVVDATATSYSLYGTQTPGSGVATYDGSAKPGGNTTNAWIKVIINGTTYYIPVWT